MLTKEEQSEFYKKVGILIRNARSKANYKQEYVANEIGLTRTSLVNIEQGIQKIQLHALLEVAKILDVNFLDLIPGVVDVDKKFDKKSEQTLSKEIDKQVNDTEATFDILKKFIKLSQTKNKH